MRKKKLILLCADETIANIKEMAEVGGFVSDREYMYILNQDGKVLYGKRKVAKRVLERALGLKK